MELPVRKPRKSFTPEGIQFAWDSTSISIAQTCLRKYQYRMIQGWRGNHESEHLRFGKHFATALEHYYKHVALGMDWLEALEAVVAEALEATWDRPACETCEGTGHHAMDGTDLDYGDQPCEDCVGTGRKPDAGTPWISTHSTKTRENLIRSIVWYIDEFHEADNLKVKILANGVPAVEYSFALPVDNGIVFSGHIDRVVEWEGNDYVMDQKTTGTTISPHWFDQFKPNTQFSMYTFAGKAAFSLPVKGVIIDGAQIAVGFTRFARSVSYRTDGELEEWYEDSMFWIAQAQFATRENHFPMNPASCSNYGGCEFRGVCSRSPGLRENFLKASFNTSDPWDPLERR